MRRIVYILYILNSCDRTKRTKDNNKYVILYSTFLRFFIRSYFAGRSLQYLFFIYIVYSHKNFYKVYTL